MAYTLTEQDEAIQTFKQQLQNIRSNEGKWIVIAPLLIETFRISFKDNRIMLEIENIETEPDSPEWMKTTFDSNTFVIECEAEKYQIEILYLVMHIWRELRRKPSSIVNDVLSESFKSLKFRWSATGEPKTDEEQRGFIGELLALVWVIEEKGEHYIPNWDASGHNRNDIQADTFHVEAKAKSKTSPTVKISFKEQLKTHDDKTVYLSVTDVNGSAKKGETLPQIRDKVISKLTEAGVSAISDLEGKIESWGLTTAIEDKFTSKYKISKTRTYEIKDEHGCAQFADSSLPEGVTLESGYTLSLSSIKDDMIDEQQIYPFEQGS